MIKLVPLSATWYHLVHAVHKIINKCDSSADFSADINGGPIAFRKLCIKSAILIS